MTRKGIVGVDAGADGQCGPPRGLRVAFCPTRYPFEKRVGAMRPHAAQPRGFFAGAGARSTAESCLLQSFSRSCSCSDWRIVLGIL